MYRTYAPRGAYWGMRNPSTPRTPRWHKEPASEKSLDFIGTLLVGRVVDEGIALGINAILEAAGTAEHPTKKQASDVIEYLKGLPYKPREDAATEPGFYLHDGQLYEIKRNRQATGIYAKVRGEFGWEYAAGAVHKLSASEQIAAERAKELQA